MKKNQISINGTANLAHANNNDAKSCPVVKKAASDSPVRFRGPDSVSTCLRESRPCPSPTTSPSAVTSPWHQSSVGHCRSESLPVIVVEKKMKEPCPPQRGASVLQPHTASKRYSCPTFGINPSSFSSSTNLSRSSPPPIQTSVITGRDPLGWKLWPVSRSGNRLSLQIPLPVIPASNSLAPDLSPKPKPPPTSKPSRRCHSDSTARPQHHGMPQPALTLEELCNVRLQPLSLSDELDDVFREDRPEEDSPTSCKRPPPVPEKTTMARQVAQLIASSHQLCRSEKSNKNIWTSVTR
ncbi:uncharacterized protein KZ484_023782 isoform 1-T2 [Pholidichthys leucotaenia]